jgi:hypothetical protein
MNTLCSLMGVWHNSNLDGFGTMLPGVLLTQDPNFILILLLVS